VGTLCHVTDGQVGDAYDHSLCESFFASLDASSSTAPFKSLTEGCIAVFQYIEGLVQPERFSDATHAAGSLVAGSPCAR